MPAASQRTPPHVGRFCQAARCGTQARGDGEAIAAATLHYAACGHHPASPSQRSWRRGWRCLGGDASSCLGGDNSNPVAGSFGLDGGDEVGVGVGASAEGAAGAEAQRARGRTSARRRRAARASNWGAVASSCREPRSEQRAGGRASSLAATPPGSRPAPSGGSWLHGASGVVGSCLRRRCVRWLA